MRLRDVTPNDLELYIGMLTDPDVMSELGGPVDAKSIPAYLERQLEMAANDEAWILALIPDETAGKAVGTIVIWESDLDGAPIAEMGWMLLKAYQGRGYGTEAVYYALLRAKAEQRWGVIHAHPGMNNVASNAICRKTGWELVGPTRLQYRGQQLRCNHWQIDLTTWNPKPFRL